jgi:hypothetical protein
VGELLLINNDGFDNRLSHRNYPLLATLPAYSHHAPLDIHVTDTKPNHLRDTQPRSIHHLQKQSIASAALVGAVGRREESLNLVWGEGTGEFALGSGNSLNLCYRVLFKRAYPYQIVAKRRKHCPLPTHRCHGQSLALELREVLLYPL